MDCELVGLTYYPLLLLTALVPIVPEAKIERCPVISRILLCQPSLATLQQINGARISQAHRWACQGDSKCALTCPRPAAAF
jgi:hypothetical protein